MDEELKIDCLVITGFAVVFAVCAFFFHGCAISPGTGEKIGQIIKVSRTGVVNKTWECQLIRGGMNGGSGSFGVQPFDFTISDDNTELLKTAQDAMEHQTEVIVKYYTPRGFWLQSDSGHFDDSYYGDAMTPQSLFEPTGAELADAGADAVSSHASLEQRNRLDKAIVTCSKMYESFTADDVQKLLGPDFDCHPNLIGARIRHIAQIGVIERCGYAKSERARRHSGVIRVWKAK